MSFFCDTLRNKNLILLGFPVHVTLFSLSNQVSSRVEYPEDYNTFSEEDRRDFRHARYGILPDFTDLS
jgi:transportin-3